MAPLTGPSGCVVSPLTPAPCRYDLVPVTTRPVAQTPAVLVFEGLNRLGSPEDVACLTVFVVLSWSPLRRLVRGSLIFERVTVREHRCQDPLRSLTMVPYTW